MTLSFQVSCSTSRVCLPTYSARAMTAENTIIAVAMTHRLRAPERIWSLSSSFRFFRRFSCSSSTE